MSSNFIGSKIAIVTKSQCRYTGTIIGIDAQASSILLGNVKCFGTENRGGSFSNGQIVGSTVPVMQFANSDIEDLNIVDEEQSTESSLPSKSMPVLSSPPSQKPSTIHDDPAIVSALISSSKKDLPTTNRLVHDFHHLNLTDAPSNGLSKPQESRIRPDSGELGTPWSLLSSSKWDNNKSYSQQPSNKSKFFDEFSLNNTEQLQPNRSQQRWPSNTHSTQTSRHQPDDSELPVRQPFFADDQPYPQQQPLQQQPLQQQPLQQQQQNRYQNGNMSYQQRSSYNNRRPPMNNQQRRPGGGNRETFQDSGYSYNADFDFETSNLKFNKIASEDDFKQQSESPNHFLHSNDNSGLTSEFEPIYDKKKSFFDNVAPEDASEGSGPMYNRFRNQDTFGNDRYQRQSNRGGSGGGGFRRPANNNYRQQQGNEDFYHRQNNNGYHYRY